MHAVADDFTSILIRRRVLTEAQLFGAQLLQRQTNDPLPNVLVEFGYATTEQVRSAVLEHDGWQTIDLADVVIPAAIIALIPESVARENVVIPLCLVDGVLHVVMADPNDRETPEKLRFILNRDIHVLIAPREQIIDCINRHYGQTDGESVDEVFNEFTETQIDFSQVDSMSKRARCEDKDIFETETESKANERVAPEPEDTDEESSDFDLALEEHELADEDVDLTLKEEESAGRAAPTMLLESRQTQLAMDDAARESMDGGAWTERSAPKTLCYDLGATLPAAAAAPTKAVMGMAAPSKPMVDRQATIRYYCRMSPERMFPLLVVIARKAIAEVVKRHVVQKQSKQFAVQLDSTVEVEPILPGCECFPPRETVRISSGEASARFYVVPRVLGEVMHARVVVRQNGVVLAEVPLEMHVAKQTLTLFVGALNFCVPFVSMLLKQSQLSLTSAEAGAGLLAALVGWALLVLSPEVMAGLLLVATVGLYFWLRPRQRDVFWDIQPVAGSGTEHRKQQ